MSGQPISRDGEQLGSHAGRRHDHRRERFLLSAPLLPSQGTGRPRTDVAALSTREGFKNPDTIRGWGGVIKYIRLRMPIRINSDRIKACSKFKGDLKSLNYFDPTEKDAPHSLARGSALPLIQRSAGGFAD